MKRTNFHKAPILFLTSALLILSIQNTNSQTLCSEVGTDRFADIQDGYRYELWNQNAQGTGCMTLDSGEWDGVNNYLARRGLAYDQTQEHQEIGRFYSTYNCTYNPSSATGNSYLSIYGWTVDPLIEYYIVEDWRNWIPSMEFGVLSKGTITVNGSTYDIYENTRVDQPSILGDTTFQQYFSIRRDERNSGTINISDHFDKWESLGMDLGKFYEVSFVVEGFQSSGSFEFSALDVFINNDPISAIGQAKLLASFSIYPNPAKDFIGIKNAEGSHIQIFNIQGQKILKKQMSSPNEIIMLTDIAPGSYIVKIINNSDARSEILIIE